jgi:hypothetical protein
MSKHDNDGSLYTNRQHADELHEGAEHAHVVGEQHGKQEHLTGHEHSRQQLEHSSETHRQAPGGTTGHGIATFGHDDIAALAHELWQARGCPAGSPEEDWFHAVAELRSRAVGR